MNSSGRKTNNTSAFGSILVGLGVLVLLGQAFGVNLERFFWPLYILLPGAVMLAVGLVIEDSAGTVLASVGGAVAMVGLILTYQNITNHWASWSYAWALVAPTAIGLALSARARLRDKPELASTGRQMTIVGLVVFVIAGVFFELVIGVSGFSLGRIAWPLVLIGLGALLLAPGWRRRA